MDGNSFATTNLSNFFFTFPHKRRKAVSGIAPKSFLAWQLRGHDPQWVAVIGLISFIGNGKTIVKKGNYITIYSRIIFT